MLYGLCLGFRVDDMRSSKKIPAANTSKNNDTEKAKATSTQRTCLVEQLFGEAVCDVDEVRRVRGPIWSHYMLRSTGSAAPPVQASSPVERTRAFFQLLIYNLFVFTNLNSLGWSANCFLLRS
jgi:hypothetical protein